jgi:Rieske Fe-S protein
MSDRVAGTLLAAATTKGGRMAGGYEDLPNGQGRVLPDRHIALYRDPSGQLHALTSVCPHRGCDVVWNAAEKLWDCPCHGSRFAADGSIVRGPAMAPLVPVEIPSAGEK